MTQAFDEKSGAPAPETTAVDVWNRTEEKSVFNLVPGAVQAAMVELGKQRPELFTLDERDLYRKLRSENLLPSAVDNRLRMQFWLEYDRAHEESRSMNMAAVYSGVCSRQLFYTKILERPEKMAWMLTAPASYVTKINEALDFGLDRLREYLEIDPLAGGKVNTKLMELQAKIVAMLDMRKHGAAKQTIEQKTMSLQVTTSDKQVAAAMTGASMEELERRMKDLERRERRALNMPEQGGAVIEAEGGEI